MKSLIRIGAIASKEVRLNMRFPLEYFATNLASPVKSAVLMLFLYRGLLTGNQSFGVLNQQNYQVYVLIGTICHSLFTACLCTFRSRLTVEKYWQTITATLISPATTLDMLGGFILGSGGIHILTALLLLLGTLSLFGISFAVFPVCAYYLVILSFFGFGLGLIGTTVSLCWEGKTFLFDYAIQLLVFASCFYYPIEAIPVPAHFMVKLLPTYQVAEAIRTSSLGGGSVFIWSMGVSLAIQSLIVLCVPAFLMNYSVKRFGIVGY